MTDFEPLELEFPQPFPQTAPLGQPVSRCPPCAQELDEVRDVCFKKLVKEGFTPRLDDDDPCDELRGHFSKAPAEQPEKER